MFGIKKLSSMISIMSQAQLRPHWMRNRQWNAPHPSMSSALASVMLCSPLSGSSRPAAPRWSEHCDASAILWRDSWRSKPLRLRSADFIPGRGAICVAIVSAQKWPHREPCFLCSPQRIVCVMRDKIREEVAFAHVELFEFRCFWSIFLIGASAQSQPNPTISHEPPR